jgi:hypothetical protein
MTKDMRTAAAPDLTVEPILAELVHPLLRCEMYLISCMPPLLRASLLYLDTPYTAWMVLQA